MSESVLVIGAGVAGMRTALDLAQTCDVVLIEKKPFIGGTMAARLNGDELERDIASGVEVPLTHQVFEHERIEPLTYAELTELRGEPGRFEATIRRKARFVTDACTQCNHCRSVCPIVSPNEYQTGMTFRKAIFSPFRDSVPATFAIDIDNCLNDPPNYLACQRCVEVCDDHAITFDMRRETTEQRTFTAVVVAVGFELGDNIERLKKLGYGTHPDVLTSMEFESLLANSGPTGGDVEKPSNEQYPESVLFVLDDTSRLAWNYSALHTAELVDQDITDITVLYPEKRGFGDGFDEIWNNTAGEGVNLVRGTFDSIKSKVDEALRVRYKTADDDKEVTRDFDLMVVTAGVQPPSGLNELAQALDIQLREDGYVQTGDDEEGLVSTSRPGIYVAGCATGPKSMPAAVTEAQAAAVYAKRHAVKTPKGNGGAKPEAAGSVAVATAPRDPDAMTKGVMIDGKLVAGSELQGRLEQLVSALIDLGEKSIANRGNNK